MINVPDPEFERFIDAFTSGSLPVKRIEGRSGLGWSAVILYRAFPFQAECFRLKANLEVVPHSHPNVDGVEWYQSGSGIFMIKGHHFPLPGKRSRSRLIRIDRNVLHGASTERQGLSFISLQKWYINEMTSVSVDWDGPREPTVLNHAVGVA